VAQGAKIANVTALGIIQIARLQRPSLVEEWGRNLLMSAIVDSTLKFKALVVHPSYRYGQEKFLRGRLDIF